MEGNLESIVPVRGLGFAPPARTGDIRRSRPRRIAPDGPILNFPALPVGRRPIPCSRWCGRAARSGLDRQRFGTPAWNPLGELVAPAGKIVVKPNWVLHRNEGAGGMDCMISLRPLLRAILEYVFLARPAQVVLGRRAAAGLRFREVAGLRRPARGDRRFHGRGLPLS
jgi:hypothetical protein